MHLPEPSCGIDSGSEQKNGSIYFTFVWQSTSFREVISKFYIRIDRIRYYHVPNECGVNELRSQDIEFVVRVDMDVKSAR